MIMIIFFYDYIHAAYDHTVCSLSLRSYIWVGLWYMSGRMLYYDHIRVTQNPKPKILQVKQEVVDNIAQRDLKNLETSGVHSGGGLNLRKDDEFVRGGPQVAYLIFCLKTNKKNDSKP